jgi:hypothetical protein
MVQQRVVQVVDDLTGAEGARTHRLRWDDSDVEIDLTDKNVADLEEVLALCLAAGRAIAASSGAPRPRPRRGSASAPRGREDARAIRDWARQHGHPVNDHGQIPRAVQDAYRAAH